MDFDRGSEPVVVSVPSIESPSHQYTIREHCDLQLSTKFLNYSGRHLVMGWRNGLNFDLQPRSSRVSQKFIVRQELYVSDNLKHSLRNRIVSHDRIEDRDMMQFKTQFLEQYREQVHGVTLKYDYVIDASDLNDNGGTIYVGELDIIVSSKQDSIPLHPFSLKALQKPDTPRREIVENGMTAYIVDNKEAIGSRFVRIMGKVVKIDPVKSSYRQDGLYVTYRGVVDNPIAPAEGVVNFIPAADIDEQNWVYRSYAQARNAPERDVEIAYDTKELEVQSKLIAAEQTVAKSEYEREKFVFERNHEALQRRYDEMDRQNQIYERELQRAYAEQDHRSKIEQLRTKDYYEDRSSSRKDQSEWLKTFPTLLVGAGAAIMALRSLF